jgi:Fe-S-cluster containining protein
VVREGIEEEPEEERMSQAAEEDGDGLSCALNGLSLDQITVDQDGELKVKFDLPVVQTTTRYEQQLQGVRVFDLYKDPELARLARALFAAVRKRMRAPDPRREAVSCERCKSSDCCRSYNVLVTEEDAERLREGLGIGEQEFRKRYLRPPVDWCGDYPFQLACDEDARGDKCVFLKETPGGQMRCSVYGFRPKICRDFDEKACDDFVPIEEVAVISEERK